MLPDKFRLFASAAALALLAGCAQMDETLNEVDASFQSAVDGIRGSLSDTDRREAVQDTLLATRYMDGDGVERDPAKAVALLRPHAEDGYADAQFLLGLAYASGQGVVRDKARATGWYQSAAEQSHPQSQYLLGLAYMRGDGIGQDLDRAAFWFQQGAKNGNAGAQYHLALNHAAANRPRDAVRWFETAAAQGHAEAQYMAGEAYHLGRGTPRNRGWATRWFAKAAIQGVPRAQYMLGLAYAAQSGVPRNLETAYRWMALAARNGETRAEKYRDGLGAKLATSARQRADAAVAAWRPSSEPAGITDRPTLVFVQHSLAQNGFDPGPIDGLSGPRTRKAIENYRSARKLGTGDGVTPDLLAALKKDWPATL